MPQRQITLHGHKEGDLFVLSSEYAGYPLRCRINSSDIHVFFQIFVEREYSCLDDVTQASFIVDCGANVGFSSAYFLSRFPVAEVVAVEPDAENFQLLSQNLLLYGNRARTIQSAIWSRPARLTISEGKYRDGREWSRQVRPCENGEAGFEALDIGTLLAKSGHERICVLKMDIEGAEAVVFSENYESWIDRVDNMVIELHEDSMFGNPTRVFEKAIANRGFIVSRCGELTVCKREKIH